MDLLNLPGQSSETEYQHVTIDDGPNVTILNMSYKRNEKWSCRMSPYKFLA